MRKALMAAGLAVGMGVANAVVLLNPGDSGFLGTDAGSGSGFASWDGTTTFGAMFDFSGTAYGYIVDDATDLVVEDGFVDAPPVHFATSGNPVLGGTYYLATSASVLANGASIAGLTMYESERFTLVPEPGTYALLAGLGLVGFAGYRRFRS